MIQGVEKELGGEHYVIRNGELCKTKRLFAFDSEKGKNDWRTVYIPSNMTVTKFLSFFKDRVK